MNEQSFAYFVRVLRCVYMGRSEFTRSLLYDIPQGEREDWYRLAQTFRDLIGDTLCLEYAHAYSSIGSASTMHRSTIGD